ncbi:Nuclear condensing complex subunit [Amanita muscaria]
MPPKSASAVLEDLKEKVAAVFDQAQASLASHRKNCVALYKLHVQAGNVTEVVKNGRATRLVGERAFGDAFVDMIARVLVVKKGPATADRVVKFVGTYVKFMNEKVADEKVKQAKAGHSISAANVDDDDDTLVSRFVSRLLKWFLQGFLAKNKIVRYRSVFIVSELISHLGEIDEEMYSLLRGSLVERVSDKESLIRAYVAVALSKLVGTEDPNEVQDGGKTILETLLEITCLDDAAEVRRAALLNIPLDNTTLDTLLSRTRDTDLAIRRLVYSMLQSKLSHPRQLSIAQRELIIKDGLGDREPTVRLAAGKLVASWFDKVKGEATIPDDETWKGDDGGVMRGFVAFLSLFDVVGPGESIAVDAMLSIFVTRPELADSFDFQEVYWKELTPESSVLARAFVEHYDSETRLEAAALPVVTAFAFYIQEAYNSLLEVLQEEENARLRHAAEAEDEEEAEKREEELAKKEVVLGELLRMALKLDYMDEIGRRKVFSVVKDMLLHPELPSSLIERCIDIMKAILPNERELIRIVVEVIIELRENDQDPHSEEENIDDSRSDASHATFRQEKSLRRKKQPHEMTAEERAIADIIDLRCLIICIALLERVHGTFEDNSTLEGILADLIIPSVKRKEPALREKGLISLGLCCLIAKNMALSSFQLFLNQVQTVPEDMKMRVIQVIFDLLTMYPQEFFNRSEDIAKRITNFLLEVFQSEVSDKVLASMAVGFSKLLLAGVITDPAVLTVLALSYVNFETRENQELRQCLAYFFPVYCYSSQMNQSRMQSIFMQSFNLFVQLHEENESDETIISPYQFGQLMIDWTNSQKAAAVNGASPVRDIHADVAVDILYALYEENLSASHRKVICQLLGQLEIGAPVDDRTLFKLHLLLSHLQQQCPLNDPALDKIFGRFKDRIYKLFSGDLEKLNADYFMDDEFSQLYQYIGIDMPNEGHEARRGRRATRITPEVERWVTQTLCTCQRFNCGA